MKQKILILLAAMLLSSVGVFAQSGNSEPLKGDVNGDGKVDMADVTALIDIILGRSGTGPVDPLTETYYWYVGQTNPSSMSSIEPIVDDNDTSLPGWRRIEDELSTYGPSKKIFEYVEGGEIITGTSLAKQYIAIPANSSACPRDGAGNDASTVDIYNKLSNVTISGVEYKVYETVGKSRKYGLDIY